MSLTFNSNSPITITYKKGSAPTQNVTKVTHNGYQVWPEPPTPTGTYYRIDNGILYFRGTSESGYTQFSSIPSAQKSLIREVKTETPIKLRSDSSYMFDGCTALEKIDTRGWDTSSVEQFNAMFNGCSSLTSLDVSGFDTSKAINMEMMFGSCSSLASLDISGFDLSSTETMMGMFYNCSSLNSLNLSSLDTSNIVNMSSLFNGCSSITSIDISNFNTSNVKYMEVMFWRDYNLEHIYVGSGWNTSSVIESERMFASCYSLHN